MTGMDLLKLIGEIDESYLDWVNLGKKRKPPVWPKLLAVAGLLAFLGVGLVWQNLLPKPEPVPEGDLPLLPAGEIVTHGMGFSGLMAYHVEELDDGNPWHEAMVFSTLPVYKNPNYRDWRKSSSDDPKQIKITAKNTQKVARLFKVRIAAGNRDLLKGYVSQGGYTFSSFSPEYIRVFSASMKPGVHVLIPADVDSSSKEALRAFGEELLKERPEWLIGKNLEMELVGGDYTYDGIRSLDIRYYESDRDPYEAFLKHQLGPSLELGFISEGKGIHCLSYDLAQADEEEKVGDYPLISLQEAEDMMASGSYISNVPAKFPEEGIIAAVDLVYLDWTSQPYLIPYYLFYVELTDPMFTRENGLKTFGLYYVPAIDPAYQEEWPVYDGAFNQ